MRLLSLHLFGSVFRSSPTCCLVVVRTRVPGMFPRAGRLGLRGSRSETTVDAVATDVALGSLGLAVLVDHPPTVRLQQLSMEI